MTKITKIVEELSTCTAMELLSIKQKLEEMWGVSAQSMVASAAPAAAAETAVEEKTEFDAVLLEVSADAKMKVMLCLKKDPISLDMNGIKTVLTDVANGPVVIKKGVPKDVAASVVKTLTEAGAKAQVK